MASPIGLAIAMLVEAFNVKEIAPVRIKIYEQALLELPPALVEPTIRHAIRTRTPKVKDWLPSVGELREDAETVRQALIQAHPYDGCIDCADSKGWRPMLVNGVTRMERCSCRTLYAAKLAVLGCGTAPLALPAAGDYE